MRYEEIRQAVDSELAGQLDTLHREFTTVHGRGTVESFVSWLHDRALIDQRTFRELHSDKQVLLTNMSTLWLPEDRSDDLLGDDSVDASDAPVEPDGEQPLVAPEQEDAFLSRYQLRGKLAEGAMGEIHIARDSELMRKVALKQMHPRIREHTSLAARFWREAQITAQLEHPAIVPVYNLEKLADGTLAYTMKLIHGRTFADLVHETRVLLARGQELTDDHTLGTRIEHFVRVCEAMAYAHARGILHRDLKPANIMVGAFGEVYVMDWGIAKRLEHDDDQADADSRVQLRETIASNKTRLGAVIGTPAFMSPEQAAGETRDLDARSDQFSLGLILFELVSLRPALPDDDTMRLLARVQDAELEPLVSYHPRAQIPPELRAIIQRATAPDREGRYPDVASLAEDIRRFQRGEVTEALPDRGLRRVYRYIRQHERRVGLMVTLLVLMLSTSLVGAIGWSFIQASIANEQAQRMTEILSRVDEQGHRVDAGLLRYEGLLTVLASNAVEASTRGEDNIGLAGNNYFLHEPFAPYDLAASELYGRRVSLGFPVTVLPPTVDYDVAGEPVEMLSVRRLALLKQAMRRVLLRSSSEEAVGLNAAAKDGDPEGDLILEEGTPVAFAYVALEDGVMVKYPGHGGFPNGWDARRQPWYTTAEGLRGPSWGTPVVDLGDLGLMLPCSMALYDDNGIFMGIAGIELTFDYLIEDLLDISSLEEDAVAFILDEEGRIVVSSQSKGQTFRDSDRGKPLLRRKVFPIREALEPIREGHGGYLEVDTPEGQRLVVYTPMESIGWTYVVVAPTDMSI